MSEATSDAPLTVVLVHGAFADSSSWVGVIEELQAAGIQVTAAANPLRVSARRGRRRDQDRGGRGQPSGGRHGGLANQARRAVDTDPSALWRPSA
jgi:predicted alpha/beta-hydrolase family hydrolase